ncbi:GNAT family N-acetyltransferase [Streptomyces sp. NPDC055912]|uniref:GNAT family N-acetyltransferase n=1 Tax=Streptomyces sp. NPDC055912 TaxID=3345660 RepID=UPI0035E36B10
MTYVIEGARPDDSAQLGPLLLTAWLQSYPNPEAGISEDWIREQRGSSATPEGIDRWREYIEAVNQETDLLFCRVVRSGTEIVGVLCGHRREVVTLGPMYLLSHVQGLGLGGRMMTEFLAWAGATLVWLWATEYNDGAVRFYQRHGFRITGERELWKGRLPNLRMAREVAKAARCDPAAAATAASGFPQGHADPRSPEAERCASGCRPEICPPLRVLLGCPTGRAFGSSGRQEAAATRRRRPRDEFARTAVSHP